MLSANRQGTQLSSRTRTASGSWLLLGGSFAGLGDGGLPRHLKHGNGVLPRDVGKIGQELVERVTAFDVVEQGLNWHARSREHRLTAEIRERDCNQGLGQA